MATRFIIFTMGKADQEIIWNRLEVGQYGTLKSIWAKAVRESV